MKQVIVLVSFILLAIGIYYVKLRMSEGQAASAIKDLEDEEAQLDKDILDVEKDIEETERVLNNSMEDELAEERMHDMQKELAGLVKNMTKNDEVFARAKDDDDEDSGSADISEGEEEMKEAAKLEEEIAKLSKSK